MRRIFVLLIILTLVFVGCKKGEQPPQEKQQSQETMAMAKEPAMPELDPTNVVMTPSGLNFQELMVGAGDEAVPGKKLKVHYTGWLEDGTMFDTSRDDNKPIQFELGAGMVIRGWEEGLMGMKVGGKRFLIIPPELGYGPGGRGPIPPNAVLKFEVELVEVM